MEKIFNKEQHKLLQNIKEEILRCLKEMQISVKNIVLFGSMARGDFSKYSDYDFLIIIDKTLPIGEKMKISKKIRIQLSKFAIDVIIKSEEEVELLKNQIGVLVREALKEGIFL